MGALSNLLEDVETFLGETLAENKFKELDRSEDELKALQASLDYRRTDYVFLVQKGYQYDKTNDLWWKEEKIDYGKFPGSYKFSVQFPDDYPKSIPVVRVKPLGSFEHSEHILDSRTGRICVAHKNGHQPDSYWKNNMNAKALRWLNSIKRL